MPKLKTSVAIIGAGPAGLLLSWALRDAGIDSVVVENRSEAYTLARIRAGVLEQGSVETLVRLGLGERLQSQGLVHDGIYLQANSERYHVDFAESVGRTVTVYGQQEVVKDLVAAHREAGSAIHYDASDVEVHDLESSQPLVTFRLGAGERNAEYDLSADFIVGADGFHGVCRPAIPADQITFYDRHYPFAWLGILCDVAPSTDELIYSLHDDGFAMHSMRSPTVSRLYLQVDPADDIADWSDERIWEGLQTRLASPGWSLQTGVITEKSITPMRSFVASRLAFGSLFLVGDAGHIVPPTGAKGLNSAISDVTQLAAGLAAHYSGSDAPLGDYGASALGRQWRVQQFSQWMTDLLHRRPASGTTTADLAAAEFDHRSQLGRIDYVAHSRFAQQSLAEQYTGLPL